MGVAALAAGAQDGFDTLEQANLLNSLAGSDGGLAGLSGVDNDMLYSVVINALETDEDSNILSTPFVTTLDNVPATFWWAKRYQLQQAKV